MYQLLALGSDEAITWSDLLFILVGILVILLILFLIRRT